MTKNYREPNTEFQFEGFHHLALVAKDMEETVDFYSNKLGMPLFKAIDLPHGIGQHFFFDVGNGDSLAFFWFPDAPPASPGVASQGSNQMSGIGSMNHVAFQVSEDKIEEYVQRLRSKGIECSDVTNHDMSVNQIAPHITDGTWARSVYFKDPNGIGLELCYWPKEFSKEDRELKAANGSDIESYLELKRNSAEAVASLLDDPSTRD
jgi:catechol 2,3-dioxygenase-like lactoylglutathione lyase family enzyme